MDKNKDNDIFIKNSNNDIFIKNSNSNEMDTKHINKKLFKEDVLKLIPTNAINKADNILAKTLAEWRWRIFKFPHKINEVI